MCDASKVQKVVNGYQNYEEMTGALDKEFDQSGGGTGYLLDLEQPRIGGQPQVTGYVAQPEYSEGSLVGQRTPDGRLLGTADQCGGAKGKLYGKKGNNNNNNNNRAKMNNNAVNNNNRMVNNANVANNVKPMNNKKVSKKKSRPKHKRTMKKMYRGKKGKRFSKRGKRHHKSKRHYKGKYHRRNKSKNRRRKHKKMKGGGESANANVANNNSVNSSNVVQECGYEVQGEGHQSVFHDNMVERTFDGKQPNWDPSTF